MKYACQLGNLEIVKLISTKFDFEKLINHCGNGRSDTAFTKLCQQGHLDCLKYLIDLQNERNDFEIDVYWTHKRNGANALIYACSSNQTKIVEYLLKELYFGNKIPYVDNQTSKVFIDNTIKDGQTAFVMASKHGNVSIMKLLSDYGYFIFICFLLC